MVISVQFKQRKTFYAGGCPRNYNAGAEYMCAVSFDKCESLTLWESDFVKAMERRYLY